MPTDKELIQTWAGNIQRGSAFRKRLYSDAVWKRLEAYFRNKYPGVKPSSYDPDSRRGLQVQVDNLLVREARRAVPKTIFGIPYLRIRPLAGRLPVHAKVLERVINGILETIEINNELRPLVLSTEQHGTSFIKVGYDSIFVPDYQEISFSGFSSGAFDKKGDRLEFSDTVFPGMPWASWQHPRNVILPEMLEHFPNARWCAFKYFRPTEDAKRDKRLSNTSGLQPVGYRYDELDPGFATDLPRYPSTKGLSLFTEVRDKETGMMYLFAEDYDKILYKEQDVLMAVLGGRLPLHPLVFNINTDYFYGTSDIEMAENELKELIDLRTQRVKSRRIAIPKLGVRKNTMSPEQMARFVSGDVGAVFEYEGSMDNIKAFDLSSKNEFILEEKELERRIKNQFGSDAFGTYPSSRRTQPEIQGSQSEAGLGMAERQALVRTLVVDIAKDIAAMVFNFWPDDIVIDVLAPVTVPMPNPQTGQIEETDVTRQVWVSFTGDELRGNFDYAISPTAGRFQDTTSSKREALELIKFFSQVPGVNMPELVKMLSDRFDGIDADRLFMPVNTSGSAMSMQQLQGMMGGGGQGQQGIKSGQQPQLGAGGGM